MPQDVTLVRSQLRQAGLRVTGPRQAVLEWLDAHPRATADEIGRGVRDGGSPVSTQAVYDVLAACTGAGLVRSIEPAGHPARHERRTGDNHHHLACRICGRIEDTDCATGEPRCLTPGDDRGYDVDEAEVVFWGVCLECSGAAPVTEPSTACTR
ncbi:MAG: Fur family transcriptional regulator [Nocardioidaceae bacterium]